MSEKADAKNHQRNNDNIIDTHQLQAPTAGIE